MRTWQLFKEIHAINFSWRRFTSQSRLSLWRKRCKKRHHQSFAIDFACSSWCYRIQLLHRHFNLFLILLALFVSPLSLKDFFSSKTISFRFYQEYFSTRKFECLLLCLAPKYFAFPNDKTATTYHIMDFKRKSKIDETKKKNKNKPVARIGSNRIVLLQCRKILKTDKQRKKKLHTRGSHNALIALISDERHYRLLNLSNRRKCSSIVTTGAIATECLSKHEQRTWINVLRRQTKKNRWGKIKRFANKSQFAVDLMTKKKHKQCENDILWIVNEHNWNVFRLQKVKCKKKKITEKKIVKSSGKDNK